MDIASNLRPALDRKRIVRVALALMDEIGLDQLSLRRIADALGVQTPALYWHMRDREEIYGLMAEELLRRAVEAVGAQPVGRAYLVALGHALRTTHRGQRDAARLIANHTPTIASQEVFTEIILARLARGGDLTNPVAAMMAVFAFTLGWSLTSANPATAAVMAQRADPDAAFAEILQSIAAGFATSD